MSAIAVMTVMGVVILYPILSALILKATERTRQELAEIGRGLLTDPQLSESQKLFVSDMLEDVFDWRFAAYACYWFPISLFHILCNRHVSVSEADRRFMTREDVSRFFDLHMRAALAASPAWTVAFMVVALLTIGVTMSFLGIMMIRAVWFDTVSHVTPKVGHGHHRLAD